MTCEEIQVHLLTSDDPAVAAREPGVAAHVASCADCRALLAKLQRLEDVVAAIPQPMVAASASKVAFLRALEEGGSLESILSKSTAARTRRSSAYHLLPRIAAVAAVLMLLISGVWMLTGDVPAADASSGVVGDLVQWNLNLAQANSPEERSQIFASAVGPLRQKVARVKLLPEDQELARMLLDNGQALAKNDDPIDDVERLNDTAGQMLKRIQVATAHHNMRAVRVFSYNYALLRATTAGSHLQKLEPPPGENPQRFERLEQMISQDTELQHRLQRLLEQSPAATKQEILKALNLPQPPARRPGALATTRPTTRPIHQGPWQHEHALSGQGAYPQATTPALSAEEQSREQQLREQRVREWFQQYKRHQQKPHDAATTAPTSLPTLEIP